MGQKVHPEAMRVVYNHDWKSNWFSARNCSDYLAEDVRIREHITTKLAHAGLSDITIRKDSGELEVNIHTARPGIVIGKSGSEVDALRRDLHRITNKQIKVNILEIKRPELDAALVAQSIAEQLQNRVAFRRAMKRALTSAMRAGPATGAGEGADALTQARQASQAPPGQAPRQLARPGEGPVRGVRAQGPRGRVADQPPDRGGASCDDAQDQAWRQGVDKRVSRQARHEEARRDAHGLGQGLARRLGRGGQAGSGHVRACRRLRAARARRDPPRRAQAPGQSEVCGARGLRRCRPKRSATSMMENSPSSWLRCAKSSSGCDSHTRPANSTTPQPSVAPGATSRAR